MEQGWRLNELQQEAMAYQRARRVLDGIKRNRLYLSIEEYKKLKKLAVQDADGAEKELAAILKVRRGL
jgi:hypothetical protein